MLRKFKQTDSVDGLESILHQSVNIKVGSSINILNTTVKKMGCIDITNVFNVLIIVMILVCDFLAALWQELGQPIFLEGIFGLTHVSF
jgi:hypothetical protein